MSFAIRSAFLVFLTTFAAGCAAETAETAAAPEATAEDDLTRAECRGPKGETEPACRVEGTVEAQVVAEFDPFVVGDACVTFVKVGARRYGLVRDVSACPDPDRFASGTAKVSFSKGALTLAARERSVVLKRYDGGATYYELSGELRVAPTPPPANRAEFDALSKREKLANLYDVQGDVGTLRPGLTEKPIRIVAELSGKAEERALAAYYAARSDAFQNGGERPDVVAIQKAGVTWAYAIHSGGRSYGNWWQTSVFDRAFEEIGGFGGSD